MLPALRLLCRIIFCFAAVVLPARPASAQLVQSSLKLTSGQQKQIHDLSARVLKHVDSVGCKKGCTILVANFAAETGSTSNVGIQLADEFSAQLAAQATGAIQIANRERLHQYLERERIASKLLEDDNAARWLATENGATVVLIGYLQVSLTRATLHVQLLDTHDFAKRNIRGNPYVDEETFTDMANFVETDSAEPFGPLPNFELPGETVFKSSASVVPSCTFRPDPPYTDFARAAKFRGSVIMEIIISKDAQIVAVRPVKGAPFGLNKTTVDTLRKWVCQPGKSDDKPVNTQVPVEVSFRFY